MAWLEIQNDDVCTRVHLGDCLAHMLAGNIKPGSVDLICTSPPYTERRKGLYPSVAESRYNSWFMDRSASFHKVLKDHGSFILNIKEHVNDGQRSLYVLKLVIDMVEKQGWRLVDTYIWSHQGFPGRFQGRFRNQYEPCFHFTKSKDFQWFPEEVMVPLSEATIKAAETAKDERIDSATQSGFGSNPANWKGRTHGYPGNVINIPTETGNHGNHSAVYPEKLVRFFVKLLSKEGDIVFDPFLGSGTTSRVANSLGRNAIGVEKVAANISTIRKRCTGIIPGDMDTIDQIEQVEETLL